MEQLLEILFVLGSDSGIELQMISLDTFCAVDRISKLRSLFLYCFKILQVPICFGARLSNF